jgi:NAD dependent epimerase/dehydratase family enzyme
VLARDLRADGHEVVIVGRSTRDGVVAWDGRTLGPWARHVDGADVVVNLAGRSVNCRYHKHHLAEMMFSRVDSTRVVGEAIAGAARPPRVWLQMSTATIYAHRVEGPPHDEDTGVLGGHEPDAPGYWRSSVDIAVQWERTLREAPTPATRKVAIRSSFAMSPDRGGIFDTLSWLVRMGWSGPFDGGRQRISWMHDADFVAALRLCIDRDELDGPVIFAAPDPLPQATLFADLRRAAGVPFGLPATRSMLALGAWLLRTDEELILVTSLGSLNSSFCRPPSAGAGSSARAEDRLFPAFGASNGTSLTSRASRAGTWCRRGCSARGSRSGSRGGPRRRRTSSRAGVRDRSSARERSSLARNVLPGRGAPRREDGAE